MSVKQVCAINPGFLDRVNSDIGSMFAKINLAAKKGKISNIREEFIKTLNEYFEKFEYNAGDTTILANHIYGMMQERPVLLNKVGNISISDLESMLNKQPTKLLNEETSSKTDKLENEEETDFNPLQPLDVLYGTSSPKTQVLNEFKLKLPELILIDFDNLVEITSQEQVNIQIHKYQEKLFQEAKEWALKNLPANSKYIEQLKNATLYDKYDNYTGVLKILNEATAKIQKDNYNSDNLERLYKRSKGLLARKSIKDQLAFLNNMAILNNFDSLLANFLKKSIRIAQEGYVSGLSKYQFNFSNTNATNTWRDDNKDIDAISESSDIVKMLCTIPEYGNDGTEMEGIFTTIQKIGLLNTKVKELVHYLNLNPNFNVILEETGLDLSPLGMSPKELAGKTIRSLVLDIAYDQVEGTRRLYTFLNAYANKMPYFNKSDIAQIKTIYNGFFNPDPKSKSLYSIYVRTRQKNAHDIDNVPQNYYTYVTQMLYTQEFIAQQEYENEEGDITSQTLAQKSETSKTYFIDNMLNGIFNVETGYIPQNYEIIRGINESKENNTFEYKDNTWGETVENPAIRIKILGTPFEIIKVGKEATSDVTIINTQTNTPVTFNSIGIEPFRNLIKEVLNLDADQEFMNEFTKGDAGSSKQLLNMVAGILYNFEVSKNLKSIQDKYKKDGTNAITLEVYKEKLNEYFDEDHIPNIQRTTTQLGYSNKQFVPVKKRIVKTKEILSGISAETTQKDAEGKQISSVGLSQIATKVTNQWNESEKFGDERPESVSAVTSRFTMKDAYVGQEFARDYTGSNGTKSAVDFTKRENFLASFVYDYMSNLYGESAVVKFMPSVISDKSRILKAKFDFNKQVEINGQNKFIKDLTTEELQQLTQKELGAYYGAIYNHASRVFNTLGSAMWLNYGIQFDYDNNFQNFNEWLESRFYDIKDDDKRASEKTKFIKSVLHDVIQKVQATNPEFKLTQNLHYTITRDGQLKGNSMLFDQLYRWGVTKKVIDPETKQVKTIPIVNDVVKQAYGLETGYGKASQFFKEKQVEFLSGLVYEDAQIRTLDGNFKEFTSVGIKKLKENSDWVSGENIVFGRLKYRYWNNEGKLTEGVLKISDKDSILRSRVYQDLMRQIIYPQYDGLRERVLVGSPKFNINALAEAIDIYTQGQVSSARLYKTLLKAEKQKELHDALYDLYTSMYGHDANDVMEATDRANFNESLFNEELIENAIKTGSVESIINSVVEQIGTVTPEIQVVLDKVQNILNKSVKEQITQYQTKRQELGEFKATVEVNPELQRYQAFDYMFSQEYMNATVGTHLNHPPGGAKTLKEQESAAWGQQVKRNVSLTASKHSFAQNLLDGIRDRYTIAVIEDDKDVVSNIFGQVGSAKPFDGATFCSIVTNYLENNSLKGDRAGVDKKQFVHDWDPVTGTGVIIKTAGFAITNARIRDSKLLADLNERMLNRKFQINGVTVQKGIDITKGYTGNAINYGEFYYKDPETKEFFKVSKNGISYDEATGDTIVKRQKLVNGKWVDAIDKRVQVTSNFDAWQEVFGGAYSMELAEGGKLIPSENSAKLLTHAVNNVGLVKSQFGTGEDAYVTSQSQVNQFMKEALIDYVVTEGAIKQGASNVNSKDAYFDKSIHLNTMSISTRDAGIQLDAEHHSDESTLSLMTQVVNALGARGYTAKQAQGVYKALQGLVQEALHDYTEGLKGDTESMSKFISKVVIDAVASNDVSTEGNLIQAITKQLQDAYKGAGKIEAQQILDNFPLDNPQVLSKSVSQISSYLTKKTVRIKFPGSMDVLNPSNKIYMLYDGKPLSFYEGKVDHLANKPITFVSDVELGRTYLLKDTVSGASDIMKVETPNDYYTILDLKQANPELEIEEVVKVGRDLGTYNVRFMGDDEVQYNIWDLDAVKNMYTADVRLSKLVKNLKKAQQKLDTLENPDEIALQQTLVDGILDQIFELGESVGIESADPKQIHNFLMKQLQKTLNSLSKEKVVKVRGKEVQIVGGLQKQAYELICGAMYKTDFGLREGDDVAEIQEDKNFFVKRALDNFLPKLPDNLYDIELKVLNGNHMYLLDGNNRLPMEAGFEKVSIQTRNINGEVVRVDNHGNKIYSMSSDEDVVYRDLKGNEVIVTKNMDYYINKTNFVTIGISPRATQTNYNINSLVEQIIKSDKPAALRMLENLSRKTIKRKDFESEEAYQEQVKANRKEAGNIINQVKEYLKQNGSMPEEGSELGQLLATDILPNFVNFIEYNHTKTLQELKSVRSALAKLQPGEILSIDKIHSYSLKNLVIAGQESHTSFLKSLKVLAARIPAQSHQSFMAMKIVGFDHSGLNSAYVNRMQIWLQGSDFDIDKVSLLGYQFRNGKMIKWSHLMSLRTPEELEASEHLPFPTSEEVELQDKANERDINLIKAIIDPMIQSQNEQHGGLGYDPETEEVDFLLHYKTSIDKSQAIRNMAKLIEAVNELGYFPDIASYVDPSLQNVYTQMQDILLKEINKHNTYTHSKGVNPKEALINFISTSMYNTSINPINLIQGQTPIDNPVDDAKDLAKPMPMNERSKLFSPGNPLSKMEQLILTLEGKKNTGIVASAMKVFEAISQYNYITLQGSDEKAHERLLVNRSIVGKEIELIANAYVEENPALSERILYALDQVNNDEDAFILFSALLSLSTDNAKDPTLAKINAGPSMMGLYTAGLTLGLNLEVLIPIMTSDIGWELSGLMETDVFNDIKGQFGLDGAIDYLTTGPVQEFKALPKEIKKQIKLQVAKFLKTTDPVNYGFINLATLERELNATKPFSDQTKKLTDDFVMSIIRRGKFNLEKSLYKLRNNQEMTEDDFKVKVEESAETKIRTRIKEVQEHLDKLKARKVDTVDQLIAKRDAEGVSARVKKYYQEQIDKFTKEGYAKYNKKTLKQIEEAENELTELSNIKGYLEGSLTETIPGLAEKVEQFKEDVESEMSETASDEYNEALNNYQDKNTYRLARFLKSLRKYKRIANVAQRSWIKSSITGKPYKAIEVIKQLNQMANEQSRLRPITTLNQSLPNDIPSMMKFLRDFENIMDDRFKEIPSKEKDKKGLKDVYDSFVNVNSAMLGEDTSKVNFNRFVNDNAYRQFIIETYDKLKFGVNIFDVMASNPHYFGYMKAADAQFEMFKNLSKVFRVIDGISKSTLSKFIKSSSDNQKYIRKTQKFVTSRLNTRYLLSQGKIIQIKSGKVYDKSGKLHDVTTPTEILLGTPEGNATFKHWMDNVVFPELKRTRFINDLIKDMTKMENGKTYNGKGLISYGLNINMFPKTEQELKEFKKYKLALSSLQQDMFEGHNIGDLLFYYNLISYNGEMLNGSLTGLYEDIIAEKSSQAANDFMLFYSQFGKDGQFIEGIDYTEDELLRYIAAEESLKTNKMPYAIVYNTDTMEKVLVRKREKDVDDSKLPDDVREAKQEQTAQAQEADEQARQQLESQGIDPDSVKSFATTVYDEGYEIVDEANNYSQDFTNNYVSYSQSSIPLSGRIELIGVDLSTSMSEDVVKAQAQHLEKATFKIGRTMYTIEDLVAQAKKNGYQDVTKEDFIVYQQKFNSNGDNELVINVEQTRKRIEEVFEENCK